MEKLYLPKTLLKTASEGNAYPYPTPLDPYLVISHKNHQESLAYFSQLAPFVLFYEKAKSKGEGA